jgi:hypothetical protein
MSNYNTRIPTNTTGWHDEEEYPSNFRAALIALAIILTMLVCICAAAGVLAWEQGRPIHAPSAPAAVQQEQKDENKEQRKERISKQLLVREWAPDNATVDTKTSEENSNSTTDEHLVLESAPQTRDCISCELGTDDYESFLEDAPGCAICLSHFEPHQLVCESNNISCDHIFHQDCMMGWLMKHKMCPLCREMYLLETV